RLLPRPARIVASRTIYGCLDGVRRKREPLHDLWRAVPAIAVHQRTVIGRRRELNRNDEEGKDLDQRGECRAPTRARQLERIAPGTTPIIERCTLDLRVASPLHR